MIAEKSRARMGWSDVTWPHLMSAGCLTSSHVSFYFCVSGSSLFLDSDAYVSVSENPFISLLSPSFSVPSFYDGPSNGNLGMFLKIIKQLWGAKCSCKKGTSRPGEEKWSSNGEHETHVSLSNFFISGRPSSLILDHESWREWCSTWLFKW